jgi:hypothetical protein
MLNKWRKKSRTSSYVSVCVLMGIAGALLLIGWASSVAAAQAPGVEIGPDHVQQAYAGDTILYDHILTNTGTTTDTFTLEVLSTQGWPVELVGAAQPTGTLSLQAAALMTAAFQVSLTVPSDAVGLTDTTIVTATSQLSSTIQDSATDTTTVVYYRCFFPVLMKHWPPIPDSTTLDPIHNEDGDGFYTVSWSVADLADIYVLEEDDSASFFSPTTVYSDTGTSWSVPDPGKSPGTYYYRVRGHNQWGYGQYSNVEAVTVLPFRIADTSLTAGQCTTLSWDFTDIKELHIVFGHKYDAEKVAKQGSRQVCPSIDTTFEAIVTKQDYSQETHELTVNVSGTGCGDPLIHNFSPTTDAVYPGKPFSIFWDVDCAEDIWLIMGYASPEEVDDEGSKMDVVIWASTVFKLKIEKTDGSFVYTSFRVHLKW